MEVGERRSVPRQHLPNDVDHFVLRRALGRQLACKIGVFSLGRPELNFWIVP